MTQAEKIHIRPQTRNKTLQKGGGDDIDELLSKTQKQLESWLTITPHGSSSKETVTKSPPITKKTKESKVKKPTGILRKPKYSTQAVGEPDNTLDQQPSIPLCSVPQRSEAAVKELVVERDPGKPQRKPSLQKKKEYNHKAVEGYTPRGEEEDVVISSVSDLVGKAGLLPDQASSISDAKVVEANLEFSVLSPEEFREHEKSLQQQLNDDDDDPENQPIEVFRGHTEIFEDDEFGDEVDVVHGDPEDDDDSEFWYGDCDSMQEEMPAPEPRAFMKLWEAISELITPEAYELTKQWHQSDLNSNVSSNWNPIIDESEIAASRCAGLMALLNLHIHRSLDDLKQPLERANAAKQRLASLLRTFNYSRPTAKLNSKLWRAMTCILIAMVLKLDVTEDVPASVKNVGMTRDEYEYMIKSCMSSLHSSSDS